MRIHTDNKQESNKQPVADKSSQNQRRGHSTRQFADSRPEAIAQRNLQKMTSNSPQAMQLRAFQEIANNSSQALTRQNNTTANTIQRMADVEVLNKTPTKIKIRATGDVDDFEGGTSAGKRGWLGVESYRSYYSITDGTYTNEGDVGPLANDFTNPEAGHILAMRNGGNGKDDENIFAQDGGTNNGPYKAFENKMSKDLKAYKDDDGGTVTFTSYLGGTDIEEYGKIADAGLGAGMDISSEDTDSD